MRIARLLVTLGAVLALATACGGSSDPAGSATPLDLTGAWQLTSGSTAAGDIALVEASPVTLVVDPSGAASGKGGCNQYSGAVTVEGTSVTFGPLASTLMACDDATNAVEAAYLGALGVVDAGATSGTGLTLTGPDVELVFEPAK